MQTCFLSMAASRELQAPLLPLLPSSSLSPKEESNCFMGFSLQSELVVGEIGGRVGMIGNFSICYVGSVAVVSGCVSVVIA